MDDGDSWSWAIGKPFHPCCADSEARGRSAPSSVSGRGGKWPSYHGHLNSQGVPVAALVQALVSQNMELKHSAQLLCTPEILQLQQVAVQILFLKDIGLH